MKNIIIIFCLLFSINFFSQRTNEYNQFIKKIKKDSKIDKNDKTVLNLLNDFYEQVLQSDKGEFNSDMPEKIQKIYSDKNGKNLHILMMFLAYQQHISQTEGIGKKADSNFQINFMTDLENEIMKVYGNVPVIVKIYKAEALNSNGQTKESAELISKSLVEFPNSIPLKVYKHLDTKDEKLKEELIKNHSKHWMVQQFGIK